MVLQRYRDWKRSPSAPGALPLSEPSASTLRIPVGGAGGNGGQQEAAKGGEGAAEATSSLDRQGLDSGLASSDGRQTYRSYRRRQGLFEKQGTSRGPNMAAEGAFLAPSLLQDSAWDAAEQLNIDEIEAEPQPFRPLLRLLDRLYQYEEDVGHPRRCEEFFQEFSCNKGEDRLISSGTPPCGRR